MARKHQHEGIAEFHSEDNDIYVRWATVGGKGLDALLEEMLGSWTTWNGKTKVRVTLEELDK